VRRSIPLCVEACSYCELPVGIERLIHQNGLLKIAREGGQMTAADLMKFEPQRRYATLVALVIEGTGTVTDEIIDLHDRIVGKLFNAAKDKHQEQFQSAASVTEAQKLPQPEDFDFRHRIGESYATMRRYAPELLDVLKLNAAPAAKPVLWLKAQEGAA
jgi:hypothetical protein